MLTTTTILKIYGMTCASCAVRLEKVLHRVDGVTGASVNLASEEAWVEGGTLAAVTQAVADAGFTAVPALLDGDDDGARESARARQDRLEWVSALVLTAPLMAGMAVHEAMLPPLVQLALTVPVQFWIGRRFYRGAWAALKGGAGTMDSLVALGTTAAFLLSCAGLWQGGPVFFESSAVVITLVLTGKMLEGGARHSAAGAVRALMSLRPELAHVVRDGTVIDVPVRHLALGDVLEIRPGERFAADGVVVAGISDANESLVTGESHAVDKSPGNAVLAGSVNGTGLLRITVTRLGAGSTLGRMVALVREAQGVKAPIQALVDRVSAVFVPVVVLAAMATLAGWGWLGDWSEGGRAAIAVLVVACPCALGLATPATVMVGVGMAARRGCLVKGAATFEALAQAQVVIFDKTGTVTEGRPRLIGLTAVDGGHDALLALMAAVQAGSEHPLARAILDAAAERALPIPACESMTALPGRGTEAAVDGHMVVMGNATLMEKRGIAVDMDMLAQADSQATLVWVAVDGRLAGLAQLADTVRPESGPAVAALRRLGLRVALLSGDRHAAVESVGIALGITELRAEASPEDKLAFIRDEMARGQRVVMVGDGLNDAAALKAAHVGIAMGNAAHVTWEAADMALMRPDPLLVAQAIGLSRRIVARIRLNLFWAFLYNVLALPLAALGHLTPVMAGGAMAASSVSVVTSALALRWFGGEVDHG